MQEQIELFSGTIKSCGIAEELKKSYLDYAMSVIIGRALPDVRDGLKPVHRRILYAMQDLRNDYNKPYKKSARIVGDVIGKYHPHGDSAVYDTIVRMAQDFSMGYPLVDGQGNFGSVDGDAPAAMRYTEIRQTKLAHELMADIDKETVDFVANYDNSLEEPLVLPSKVPNLLINGSSGIAVGMATNIPPHNLGEVVDALIALIRNPNMNVADIMEYIPGPDFPTAGFICGKAGIKSAYEVGRGIIKMRARAVVEQQAKGKREHIVINQIPYQVNKAKLVEKIAQLTRDKKIEGIHTVRDESDRDGMRIVVELKKDGIAQVVLNHLYKHTAMGSSFGTILLAIVNGRPELLNLKEVLAHFLQHRKTVIIRRTTYELKKAEERAHILKGLKIALDNLDEVVALIRGSSTPAEARSGLIEHFGLTTIQAQAILDMKLQRLTGLERGKILEDYQQLLNNIKSYKEILASDALVLEIIEKELRLLKDEYAIPRRTELIGDPEEIRIEDLIVEEDMVVTLSHSGYIKRNPLSLYHSQRRGGKGITGLSKKQEDFVVDLFVASTHDYFLYFSNLGRLYWLKVHEIPQASRTSRGKALINLLPIDREANEHIAAVVPVRTFEPNRFVIMATKNGVVKKTSLEAFSRPRPTGIIAATVRDGDEIIAAAVTDGQTDIFLGTRHGHSIRFPEGNVRPMGRTAAGVRGIKLAKGDRVVAMVVISEAQDTLFTVTENGYGKRTQVSEYRVQSRGGKGVINIKTTEKVGPVVGVILVNSHDEVMLIGTSGNIIRIGVQDVRIIGRSTQGVRLIRIKEGDHLAAVAKLAEQDEE
ncbi:MAG: DNA gyrase subunit A [Deltaproteobacteria bacterium]|nr:DNA gyrase subunit A [Deltaproteobacteria bacterium]MBW1932149.1 DNA gyrase subunit A [Deltaproteobacteria bacterium]MBW1964734.1 DNA gyrase subunit A [Deltaproteobacteria bacterium]MBW2079886.1 DNA gyrase subunit A [Deltaproteobacteria bacterium]